MELTLIALWGLVAANFALFDIALKIIALIIIPNNRKPSAATAWLLAIFFIPAIGLVLFFLLGNSKLSKPRRQKQQKITSLINDSASKIKPVSHEAEKWFSLITGLNTSLGALPPLSAKNFQLIDEYDYFFKLMAGDIRKAKKTINFEFYISSFDLTTLEIFDELAAAAKRGVTVRVMYDHLGSWLYPGYKKLRKFLDQNGIEHHKMMPITFFKSRHFQRPDLRNHRKILTIDGQVGYVGSQNIIDRTYLKKKNIKRGLKWQELMVRLQGDIVKQLEAVFASDWYMESGKLIYDEISFKAAPKSSTKTNIVCQIIPSGPAYESANNLKLFNSLMYNAREKIIITSPYFVPNESMLDAICTASQRGLEVVLFVSEIGDQFLVYHAQRSYYEALMEAGVKIYMYKSPYVLHAKHLTIDDNIAVVGSSNMDIRSIELNQEASLLVNNKKFVKDMRKIEEKYFKASKRLDLRQWRKRPYYLKIIDNLARLTSALQ